MNPGSCWLVCEDLGGLRSQARGLAEVAGISAEERLFTPRFPWSALSPRLWPAPERVAGLSPPYPDFLIGCGGNAAAVLAALHGKVPGVIIQHPRMDLRKFDFIITAPHDRLSGSNVFVARTALHGMTPRLAAARATWTPRLAHLPRPLVSVLVGGSNGRFQLNAAVAETIAADLRSMMRSDKVGLALTPSRRTAPDVRAVFQRVLAPEGAFIWDMAGENPYVGMLACADAILVTEDSVSMVSEAVATSVPVLTIGLPGKSRRIRAFTGGLMDAGRVRAYRGRLETWAVEPLDDTPAAAAALRQRFGW
ncbi:MAG: mitochondrial fission ELM1 family protein [Rhodospirillales bacterium]|nr:mitochondrial fission ELM1 family protein [Rhodospirillales bacterium]